MFLGGRGGKVLRSSGSDDFLENIEDGEEEGRTEDFDVVNGVFVDVCGGKLMSLKKASRQAVTHKLYSLFSMLLGGFTSLRHVNLSI